MRLQTALVGLMAGLVACQSSTVSADDLRPTPTVPQPSNTASPDDSPADAAPADASEFTENPPAATSADDVAPPPPVLEPIYWFPPIPPSPPEPSYEEVSEGYPAPAHSLVPSALFAGPLFFRADHWRAATTHGVHIRFPYYNYRSPWTYGGPASVNHTIIW